LSTTSRVTIEIVAWICFIRVGWHILGLARLSRYRKRAIATRWSWVELSTLAEPFVQFAVTYLLYTRHVAPSQVTDLRLLGTTVGAVLTIAGLSLSLWSFYAFPTMSSGHYILSEQRVITYGPYRWVRHPAYLAVLLLWAGLSLAFASRVALLLTILFVIPILLLYVRSEEEMMMENLPEAYGEYRKRVGMLIPCWRRRN